MSSGHTEIFDDLPKKPAVEDAVVRYLNGEISEEDYLGTINAEINHVWMPKSSRQYNAKKRMRFGLRIARFRGHKKRVP